VKTSHVLLAMLGGMLVTGLFGYWLGIQQPEPEAEAVSASYRRGSLPEAQPVIVFWIEDNGIITGCSAIATSHAGVLPYSLVNAPVNATPLEGWFAWTPLDPMKLEVLE